jgi:multidrug resistance efflux pump
MKRSSRPLLLGGLLGLVLLVGSVAGSRMLNGGPGADSPGATDPATPAVEPRTVVCIGYADVEPGITPLYPLQPGRVEAIPVREGETVTAGQVLLRLDRRTPEALVVQARADLDAAEAQQEIALKGTEQQALREAQQQEAIEAVRQRLRAAEELLKRREDVKDLAGSPRELEAARAGVAEARAVLRAEEKKLLELKLNDPRLALRRAEAEVRARQGKLQQAEAALAECELKAPTDGTVLRILVNRGETLGPQPRQPAILFCPKGDRIIRAEVEQEFAGRVALGQHADIRDDSASSGGRWTGRLIRLSDWYTHRRSIIQEPLQFNDVRTLECIIKVDPSTAPLRIGQRVRVTLGGDGSGHTGRHAN